MDIASSCPACGAQMSIASGARKTSCPYCGMAYDVDLSEVEPVLRVATPSTEMPDVPEPIPAPPPPFATPPPPISPQFIPAQPKGDSAEKPGGFLSSPRVPKAISRQPVWVIIAVIVGLILCVSFGCLALGYAAITNFL